MRYESYASRLERLLKSVRAQVANIDWEFPEVPRVDAVPQGDGVGWALRQGQEHLGYLSRAAGWNESTVDVLVRLMNGETLPL